MQRIAGRFGSLQVRCFFANQTRSEIGSGRFVDYPLSLSTNRRNSSFHAIASLVGQVARGICKVIGSLLEIAASLFSAHGSENNSQSDSNTQSCQERFHSSMLLWNTATNVSTSPQTKDAGRATGFAAFICGFHKMKSLWAVKAWTTVHAVLLRPVWKWRSVQRECWAPLSGSAGRCSSPVADQWFRTSPPAATRLLSLGPFRWDDRPALCKALPHPIAGCWTDTCSLKRIWKAPQHLCCGSRRCPSRAARRRQYPRLASPINPACSEPWSLPG